MGSDDIDVESSQTSLEEIDQMIEDFRVMAKSIQEYVHVVQRVAEGDMTAFVNIRSYKDSLAKNLYKMVQTNAASVRKQHHDEVLKSWHR